MLTKVTLVVCGDVLHGVDLLYFEHHPLLAHQVHDKILSAVLVRIAEKIPPSVEEN